MEIEDVYLEIEEAFEECGIDELTDLDFAVHKLLPHLKDLIIEHTELVIQCLDTGKFGGYKKEILNKIVIEVILEDIRS